MQKWEYCVIHRYRVLADKFVDTKLYRFTDKGMEVVRDFQQLPEKARDNAVAQLIAQLGEEGWELAGAGNVAEAVHALYFKRIKE